MTCDAQDIISRIRRAVHDADMTSDGKPLYKDDTYIDALRRAIRRVNIDLCASYTLETLTDNVEYLVELRGIIEMSHIRSGEGASSDVQDLPEGGAFMVQVPHLLVQQQPPQLEGTRLWRNLITQLETSYKEALKGCIENDSHGSSQIKVGVLTRTSLRTGRLTERRFAYPPPATTLTATIDGADVVLNWDTIRDTQFSKYEVLRSSLITFATSTRIFFSEDAHATTYTDNPGVGTWFYKVRVLNTNNLKADSAAITVTI